MRESLLQRFRDLFGSDDPEKLLERAQREMEARVEEGRRRLQAGAERRDSLQARAQTLETRLDEELDPLQTARITEELEAVCEELEATRTWLQTATEKQRHNESVLARKLEEAEALRQEWRDAKAADPDIERKLNGWLGRTPPLVTPVRRRGGAQIGVLVAAVVIVLLLVILRRGRA